MHAVGTFRRARRSEGTGPRPRRLLPRTARAQEPCTRPAASWSGRASGRMGRPPGGADHLETLPRVQRHRRRVRRLDGGRHDVRARLGRARDQGAEQFRADAAAWCPRPGTPSPGRCAGSCPSAPRRPVREPDHLAGGFGNVNGTAREVFLSQVLPSSAVSSCVVHIAVECSMTSLRIARNASASSAAAGRNLISWIHVYYSRRARCVRGPAPRRAAGPGLVDGPARRGPRASRAMISKIERRESSPTAVVLGRLSAALGSASPSCSLAPGCATAGNRRQDRRRERTPSSRRGRRGRTRRAADTPQWRDPIRLPAPADSTAGFPAAVTGHAATGRPRAVPGGRVRVYRPARLVQSGQLTLTDGSVRRVLAPDDTFELGQPRSASSGTRRRRNAATSWS